MESDAETNTDRRWWRGSQTISWSELLEHRFVVVLGEAGVGNTIEMSEQARGLRASGRRVIFIRLDDLAHEDFERAIDPENAAAFNAWSPGIEEAIFFLDSIDEAKLDRPGAFNRPLRKFVKKVSSCDGD